MQTQRGAEHYERELRSALRRYLVPIFDERMHAVVTGRGGCDHDGVPAHSEGNAGSRGAAQRFGAPTSTRLQWLRRTDTSTLARYGSVNVLHLGLPRP